MFSKMFVEVDVAILFCYFWSTITRRVYFNFILHRIMNKFLHSHTYSEKQYLLKILFILHARMVIWHKVSFIKKEATINYNPCH